MPTIITALLLHQRSKVCSQSTMPGERIAYSVHIVLALRLPGFCRLLLLHFMFSA